MQSAWIDRDAEAAVARYADLGRDLALRVYTTRLLGSGPAAGAARRRQHLGENPHVADLNGDDVDVICVKGSGWDMGSSSRRACRRCGSRRCASFARATRFPTRTWSTSARQSDRSAPRPTRRSRRCCTPSCRINSSTIPIRPRCWRSPTSPTAKRLCREVYGARVGYVPYHDAGLRLWPKRRREVFDARSRRSRA